MVLLAAGAASPGPAGAAPSRVAQAGADPCANLTPAVTAECRKGVAACAKARSVSLALEQKCLAQLTKGLDPLRRKGAPASSSSTDTGAAGSGDSGATAAGAAKREVSAARSTEVVSVGSMPADGKAPVILHVTVRDAAGSPIAGDAVRVHGTGSSAGIRPASAVSDSHGVATFTVTDATPERVKLDAQVESNGRPLVLTHTVGVSFTTPAPSAAHSSITCVGCTVVQSSNGVSSVPPGTYACINSCTNGSSISLHVTIDDSAGVPLPGYTFWLEARPSNIVSPAAFFEIDPNTWTNAPPQNKGLYRGIETTDANGTASLTVYLNTLRFKDDPGTASFLVCAPLSNGPYFATFVAMYKGAN